MVEEHPLRISGNGPPQTTLSGFRLCSYDRHGQGQGIFQGIASGTHPVIGSSRDNTPTVAIPRFERFGHSDLQSPCRSINSAMLLALR